MPAKSDWLQNRLALHPLQGAFVSGFRSLRAATRGRCPLDPRKPFEKGLTENFRFC